MPIVFFVTRCPSRLCPQTGRGCTCYTHVFCWIHVSSFFYFFPRATSIEVCLTPLPWSIEIRWTKNCTKCTTRQRAIHGLMQMMDSSAADELLETRSRVVGFRLRVQRICGKTGQETGWQGSFLPRCQVRLRLVSTMCNSLRQSFASGIRACARVSQSHWSLRLLSWSLWQRCPGCPGSQK